MATINLVPEEHAPIAARSAGRHSWIMSDYSRSPGAARRELDRMLRSFFELGKPDVQSGIEQSPQ
jgi:hypothetical protein